MPDAVQTFPEMTSSLRGRPLRLHWAVTASVAAHGLLLAVFLFGAGVMGNDREPLQKPMKARLVRLGAKRDPKMLPRKPAEAPVPAPPPKAVEVPVPGVKPAPVPVKAQPPASRTSASGPADAKQLRNKLFAAFDKTAAKAEELEGDPEGDPEGDSDTAEEGERYFGLILAKARRNYGVTRTIAPHELAKLKAVVVLYISGSGELMRDPVLQTSSGNAQFDQDVLLSLRRAAPFGPPPQHLAATLRDKGIAIEATP